MTHVTQQNFEVVYRTFDQQGVVVNQLQLNRLMLRAVHLSVWRPIKNIEPCRNFELPLPDTRQLVTTMYPAL